MTQSETLCQQSIQRGGAADGKDTMGWCHGFKLHLLCNDRGEIITFCLLQGYYIEDSKQLSLF